MKTPLTILLFLWCLALAAPAQTLTSSPTLYTFGTNTFPGGGAPGGSTNFAPYVWITTNLYATNWGSYVTNIFSGWIDNTKEPAFCVQTGCTVSAGPGTNVYPIIWCFEPSLDGVNADGMNDRSFWVTNTVGNVPSGAGTTNSAINIITFPSDQSFGIGYFLLAAIINPNTNGFTGAIINGTYTNNVMLQTGTKRIGG